MISLKKKFKLSYQIFLIAIFYWLFYLGYFNCFSENNSLAYSSDFKKLHQEQVGSFQPEVSSPLLLPTARSFYLRTPSDGSSFTNLKTEIFSEYLPTSSFSPDPLQTKKEYLFIEESQTQKSPSAASDSSLVAPKEEKESQYPKLAKLRIVIDGVFQEYELEIIPQKTTVLDLLLQARQKYGLEFSYRGEGPSAFIESIAGISNSERYWLYYINGEFAQRGAGSQKVKEGDLIEWRYE